MRDPNRIPQILAAIEKIWLEDPDLRLGQLMVIATNFSGKKVTCPEIFSLEDDDILKGLADYAALKQTRNSDAH